MASNVELLDFAVRDFDFTLIADFRDAEIDDTFSMNLVDVSGFFKPSVIEFPGPVGV